jgi:hypothetical protein
LCLGPKEGTTARVTLEYVYGVFPVEGVINPQFTLAFVQSHGPERFYEHNSI